MVNKKGYMKTVEAIFAVIIFFSVVLILVGKYAPEEKATPDDIRLIQDAVSNTIESDHGLREDILTDQTPSVNAALSELIPPTLEYNFTICPAGSNPCPPPTIDQSKTVYVSSLVLASTYDQTYPNTLFRLFLYRRIERT